MKMLSSVLRKLALAAFVVASLALCCFAASIKEGCGFVTSETGLCLRSAPSNTADCKIIAAMDDTVIVISRQGEWSLVKYNLMDGYMRSEYIDFFEDTEDELDLGRGMAYSACNMRTEPNTNSPSVMLLPVNKVLDVIGIVDGWYRIYYNDQIGYVRSDLIDMVETPANNSPGILVGIDNTLGAQAIEIAKEFLGYRYVFGARNPSIGFDCSGLVQYIAERLGKSIARTAQQQSAFGTYVPYEELQIGDLVFFVNTYNCPDLITHVGFYYGNGQFLHAGGDHVQISNLSQPYYASRYYTARRFFN